MGGEFEQSTVCGIDVQVHVSYAGRYTAGAGLCVRACVRACVEVAYRVVLFHLVHNPSQMW